MRYDDDADVNSAIMESISTEANTIEKSSRFHIRKRTRIGYHKRVLVFIIVYMLLLLPYMASFIHDGSMGPALNETTDNIVTGLTSILLEAASISQSHIDTILKLATFGPMSVIISATVLAIILTMIITSVTTHIRTKHALDDGTPNFKSEPWIRREADSIVQDRKNRRKTERRSKKRAEA